MTWARGRILIADADQAAWCWLITSIVYWFLYVYRSCWCIPTVHVCLQFMYVYCSCMSTVCVCLPFMYVYHSRMSTFSVCLPFCVYLPFVHIYSLSMSTVSFCVPFVYGYPSYMNVYNFQFFSNNFFYKCWWSKLTKYSFQVVFRSQEGWSGCALQCGAPCWRWCLKHQVLLSW